MEILNETFCEEISFNILRYMRHPTAEIIKGVFRNSVMYEEGGLIDEFLIVYILNKNCRRCHKFRSSVNKFSAAYCRQCYIIEHIEEFSDSSDNYGDSFDIP